MSARRARCLYIKNRTGEKGFFEKRASKWEERGG